MRIQATKRAMEQKMIRKIPFIKFEMDLPGLLVKIISLPYNLLARWARSALTLAKSCGNGISYRLQPVQISDPALAKLADFIAEMTG